MPYIITFLIFLVFFLIQKHVIYPIEQVFFSDEILQLASVLYLPHCIRVLSYYVLGFYSIIPIFLSQLLTNVYFNDAGIINSVSLSFMSTFSIVLGFKIFYFFNEKTHFKFKKIIEWKILIVLGSIISIFNSFLSSIYFSINSSFFDLSVIFRFIIGDILGMIAGMFLFIFIIKLLRHRILNGNFKNQ